MSIKKILRNVKEPFRKSLGKNGKMAEIITKNANKDDLDEVVRLENEIWPEGTRATKDKFESRLKIFQDGFFLAYKNNELISVSTSEIIKYDPSNPPKSWEYVTDRGYITKTHNPRGNALYVVSIGAKARSGGGSALLQAQKKLTEKLDLRFLVLGARIPGYDAYCKQNRELPIKGYAKLKRADGELYDSELRFYMRNGLKLTKVMPDYMDDDKESRNYGAIMTWENPKSKVK